MVLNATYFRFKFPAVDNTKMTGQISGFTSIMLFSGVSTTLWAPGVLSKVAPVPAILIL
jgi:hypothetical protein